jgi:hypothetical protein
MKLIAVGKGSAGSVPFDCPTGATSLMAVSAAAADANTNLIRVYISADPNETFIGIESGFSNALLAVSNTLFPAIPVEPEERLYAIFTAKGSAVIYFDE